MMVNLRGYRRDVCCPNAAPTGCPKPVLPKAVRSIAAVNAKIAISRMPFAIASAPPTGNRLWQ